MCKNVDLKFLCGREPSEKRKRSRKWGGVRTQIPELILIGKIKDGKEICMEK